MTSQGGFPFLTRLLRKQKHARQRGYEPKKAHDEVHQVSPEQVALDGNGK